MGNTLSCVPWAKHHTGVPDGTEASSPGVWRVGFVLHPQASALTKILDGWWGGIDLKFCMQIWLRKRSFETQWWLLCPVGPHRRVNGLHFGGGVLCFLYLVSLQSEGRGQADRPACVHNLMFCGAVMNCAVGVCLQVNSAVINHFVDLAHERCSVFSSRWARCQDCPPGPAFTI